MLSRWLDAPTYQTFREQHLAKLPFSQPFAAKAGIPYFTWEVYDRILQQRPRPDTLVVRQGALVEQAPPASAADVHALFSEGKSVVTRKGELHDPGLRAYADAFALEFDGPATIQLFGTPQGTHGFGWHYDVEDVFLVQTAGIKEYFLRRNTVNPQPTVNNMPKDLQYEKETSPMAACTLVPGDWLYIPSGWWHVARCLEDSLSISTGVLSKRARG